jgi:DNA-binding MarR family transcriptional regulator
MEIDHRRVRSVGYLTNWAARLFARALERRLASGNLGPMPVYFALMDGAALSQKELTRRAAVEQPTMANTLARMERDKLIERTPDPADGRSALVSLTPLGHSRAEAAFATSMTVNEVAFAALTPVERTQFTDMLMRVIEQLEADGRE